MRLRGLASWSTLLRWLGKDLRETRMQGVLWVPAALFGAQSPLTAPFFHMNNPRSEPEPHSATASRTRKSAGTQHAICHFRRRDDLQEEGNRRHGGRVNSQPSTFNPLQQCFLFPVVRPDSRRPQGNPGNPAHPGIGGLLVSPSIHTRSNRILIYALTPFPGKKPRRAQARTATLGDATGR